MEKVKSGLVHVAGPYAEGMQFCLICGGVICDDRNAMVEEAAPPLKGFPEGCITALGNTLGAYEDENLPRCSVPPSWPVSLR